MATPKQYGLNFTFLVSGKICTRVMISAWPRLLEALERLEKAKTPGTHRKQWFCVQPTSSWNKYRSMSLVSSSNSAETPATFFPRRRRPYPVHNTARSRCNPIVTISSTTLELSRYVFARSYNDAIPWFPGNILESTVSKNHSTSKCHVPSTMP